MNRRQILALGWHGGIGALLMSLVGLLPLAAQQPDRGPASPAAAVSRALGEEFRWTEQRPGKEGDRDVLRLIGEDAQAAVDVQTGLLVYFHSYKGEPAEGAPAITAEEALKRAEAFLTRVGVPIRGVWTLVESRFFDHGAAGRDYEFQWKKFFHGIELPAYLRVSVNADSGLVAYYLLEDQPVVVPLVVRLSAAQAVRLVVGRSGMTAPVVEEVRPRIGYRWFAPQRRGPQTIFWRVQLRDTGVKAGSVVIANVDAQTGEIVTMLPPPVPPAAGKQAGNRATAGAKGAKLPPLPKVNLARARKAKPPRTVFQLAQERRGR